MLVIAAKEINKIKSEREYLKGVKDLTSKPWNWVDNVRIFYCHNERIKIFPLA